MLRFGWVKNLFVAVGLLLTVFGLCSISRAQGVIVPIICERAPRCPVPPRPFPRPIVLPLQLPIKSIKFDTKIVNQIATTHVEQVFRNDSDATLEGTYFFPIPETASISEFAIWENGKKLVGEVRSREEARRIYESIVRRQRDPGLLEYAGKNLFQATIFPIPPRSDKKLELTYTQILTTENNTTAYRYPLGTGGRAFAQQSVIPFEDGVAPNVNRARPTPIIGTIAGRIEIEGAGNLRNIYSPSHQIETKKNVDNRAVLTFETSGKTAPQDFQLFYTATRDDFGLSLTTYREAGKDGYFLLNLAPKDQFAEREFAAKDIIFVLDTSGSMADEGKIEKARKALLFGIQGLRDTDRFNVIGFAGEEHLMESNLIRADATGRKRGAEFVNRLQPTGGTNINDALRAAIRQFDASNRPQMIVFMTDGLPTVGETNAEKIVQNARDSRKSIKNLHLFTFGVGYDVNTQLLDKLASENGGTADYIEPKEDLEIKVGNFFAKVNSPVLTDLEINWGGADVELIYPRQMPDLFKGTQVILIGRYRAEANGVTLTLRGRANGENRAFTYQNINFPRRAEANDFLPRLWATRRVGWLVEQIRANGEQKELRDEIVDLGTRYGIVTPYTSYLAVDATDGGNARISADSASRSVGNSPLNGRRNKDLEARKPSPLLTGAIVAGADAVAQSKQQRAQQEVVTVTAESDQIISTNVAQKVGTKTFYRENDVWQDADFKPDAKLPEVKLKFASDEYFDLLKREKDLAQYFALGEQVTVVYQNKVYRVVK